MLTGTVSLLSACLGVDLGGLNALVEPGADFVDEGHDDEQAGAANGRELAEPEHDRALPLVRDHDGLRDQERDDRQAAGKQVGAARRRLPRPARRARRRPPEQGRKHHGGSVGATCKIVIHDGYSFCLARALIRSARAGVDACRGGHGESLFRQIVDLRRLGASAHRRRRVGHETSASANQLDGAHPLELVVGVADRVEVDLQGDGHFAHGRHLVAGREHARAELPQDLLSKLDVDRNARIIETKGCELCMH